MSLCAPWEQPNDGPIDRHCLIGFVLYCEGVCHAYPRVQKRLVKYYSFLEILPSHLVLFAVEVIGADCEPTDRMRRVILD
jgi:hypothetical protein